MTSFGLRTISVEHDPSNRETPAKYGNIQMTNSKVYDDDFYKSQQEGSLRSAKIILEDISSIIHNLFENKTVRDIGCGVGTWLSVASESLKARQITGYDFPKGNIKTLVPRDKIVSCNLISVENFEPADITFCLEVMEHVEESLHADLIEKICKNTNIIIFSAAAPLQGGTGHVSERNPKYWKKLFENNNFNGYDIIRPRIWENEDIEYWYRQNILIFTKELILELDCFPSFNFSHLVHPILLADMSNRYQGGRKAVRDLFKFLKGG